MGEEPSSRNDDTQMIYSLCSRLVFVSNKDTAEVWGLKFFKYSRAHFLGDW